MMAPHTGSNCQGHKVRRQEQATRSGLSSGINLPLREMPGPSLSKLCYLASYLTTLQTSQSCGEGGLAGGPQQILGSHSGRSALMQMRAEEMALWTHARTAPERPWLGSSLHSHFILQNHKVAGGMDKQMRFYQSLRGREQVVKSTKPWFRLLIHVLLFREASEAMLAK